MDIGKEKEYWSKIFEGVDIAGEVISSVSFEDCTFSGCNFSNATFNRCVFIDCEFLNCNLSVTDVGYSKFSGVVFRESKAVGMDWTKATWPDLLLSSLIRFVDSVINESSFMGLSLQELAVEGCVAHNVDFRDGDFSGSCFQGTDFSGALFSSTNLSKANFSGASNYDIDIFSNNIKKAKFDRLEAISLLSSLDVEFVD